MTNFIFFLVILIIYPTLWFLFSRFFFVGKIKELDIGGDVLTERNGADSHTIALIWTILPGGIIFFFSIIFWNIMLFFWSVTLLAYGYFIFSNRTQKIEVKPGFVLVLTYFGKELPIAYTSGKPFLFPFIFDGILVDMRKKEEPITSRRLASGTAEKTDSMIYLCGGDKIDIEVFQYFTYKVKNWFRFVQQDIEEARNSIILAIQTATRGVIGQDNVVSGAIEGQDDGKLDIFRDIAKILSLINEQVVYSFEDVIIQSANIPPQGVKAYIRDFGLEIDENFVSGGFAADPEVRANYRKPKIELLQKQAEEIQANTVSNLIKVYLANAPKNADGSVSPEVYQRIISSVERERNQRKNETILNVEGLSGGGALDATALSFLVKNLGR